MANDKVTGQDATRVALQVSGGRWPAADAEARAFAEFYGGAALLMVATGKADEAGDYAALAASYAAEVL